MTKPMQLHRKMAVILTGSLLGFLMLIILPSETHAEERTCTGTLSAVTVDSLRVPQSATCTLNGTSVRGAIKVERDATLDAHGVRVGGNVQAEKARKVVLTDSSHIGGSVQVKEGGAATVTFSRIVNDIHYDDNRGYLKANDNNVGGNFQLFGSLGGVEIFRNVVDGNLQCKDNRPAPTGGDNTVGGNKDGQCRRF
jgi:hypothetical protein